MKAKNKRSSLGLDERNWQLMYRIMAVMYLITILAMQGIVIYRQFALGQDIHDFEDLAILMTINSIFLVSALLYFGVITIQKLKIKTILLLYLIFVAAGSLFTYAKYNIFQSPGLSFTELLDKLLIIFAIIGLLMGFWIILTLLGKRRMEKELE